MHACCDVLSDAVTVMRNKILSYVEAKEGSYFNGQDFEVDVHNGVYAYRFTGQYISELYLVAMCCFVLDENTPFCAATVERYDSKLGFIKIKHASPSKLLLASIDKCLKDLETIRGARW
jgi:hypothetical protein